MCDFILSESDGERRKWYAFSQMQKLTDADQLYIWLRTDEWGLGLYLMGFLPSRGDRG